MDKTAKLFKAIAKNKQKAAARSLRPSFFALVKGADIGARNEKGVPPLTLAAWHGDYEIVELLLDAGADIDALDNDKDIPLTAAVQRKNEKTASLLYPATLIPMSRPIPKVTAAAARPMRTCLKP
jgi:hypothetical protein